jgi:hypothetical protein
MLTFLTPGGEVVTNDMREHGNFNDLYLGHIAAGERLETIVAQFTNDKSHVFAYESDGVTRITNLSRTVATGMIIRLYDMVVQGDLLGRGTVDSLDITVLQAHFFVDGFALEKAFFLAADTLGRGTVDSLDFTVLQAHFFVDGFSLFDGLLLTGGGL